MGGGDPLGFQGLILVVLPGVLVDSWSVKYPVSSVFTVTRSAVVIPCEYDYPGRYRVENVMWCHNSECLGKPYVYHTDKTEIKAEYKDRAEYLGNKEKNCTLKIKKVTDTDAGVYRFRFTTDRQEGSWTGQLGVTLKVDGVLGGDWNVKYPVSPICAVRGSAVVIPCEYDYPSGDGVEDVMWCRNGECFDQPPYVYHTDKTEIKAEYKDRAEYLGNREKNCTLKIKKITDTDAGVYRFRFTTDRDGGKWTGQLGVTLQVGEFKLVMISSGGNGTLREGDSVNLTCDTGICSLSQSEFTWFKDNQLLPETQSTLQFDPVSYHHSGKYWCALKGYREKVSDVILLDVHSKSNPTFIFIVVGTSMAILAITLVIIICMMKRKTNLLSVESNQGGRTKNCATDSHSDNYATLDVRNRSPDYDTLTVVKSAANERNNVLQKPTNHEIYENV